VRGTVGTCQVGVVVAAFALLSSYHPSQPLVASRAFGGSCHASSLTTTWPVVRPVSPKVAGQVATCEDMLMHARSRESPGELAPAPPGGECATDCGVERVLEGSQIREVDPTRLHVHAGVGGRAGLDPGVVHRHTGDTPELA
jgi:hypothetical protein